MAELTAKIYTSGDTLPEGLMEDNFFHSPQFFALCQQFVISALRSDFCGSIKKYLERSVCQDIRSYITTVHYDLFIMSHLPLDRDEFAPDSRDSGDF